MIKTNLEKALAVMLIVAALVIANYHMALRTAWKNQLSQAKMVNPQHSKPK
jgi:cell division protein FtsL